VHNNKQVVSTGGRARDVKTRIVDRKVKVGFHNGHALVLPDSRGRWVEASLIETDDDDVLILTNDLARYLLIHYTHIDVCLVLLVRCKYCVAIGAALGTAPI
jgi:hypothetical protein